MTDIRKNNFIIEAQDFDLKETLDCGQCFRWTENTDGSFDGVVRGYYAHVYQEGDQVFFDSNGSKEFWKDYFDFDRNYSEIKKHLTKDNVLKMAIEYAPGIHLLKQEFFECLISFIISQCNNIPRIKKNIELLCENFGKKKFFGDVEYYTFPAPQDIINEDLSIIRVGYRLPYIICATRMIIDEVLSYESILNLESEIARQKLLEINGVGNKVADCILLFSLQKFDVFPSDTWIKKIMEKLYGLPPKAIKDYAQNNFFDFSGFAQQYLFFYAMNNKSI